MILTLCLRSWLQRYGEPVQIGLRSERGLFFQPPAGLLRWYFSPEERESLPRPLWAVALEPRVPLPEGATLVWRGATYRVLRQSEFRFGTTPLYRLLLIEPVGSP